MWGEDNNLINFVSFIPCEGYPKNNPCISDIFPMQ